jgi:hypothetical protein
MKIDVSLSTEDWKDVVSEKERSRISSKEFWYKKRNYILDKIHNTNLSSVTEKELLLAILEMNTKVYWELRKLNEKE